MEKVVRKFTAGDPAIEKAERDDLRRLTPAERAQLAEMSRIMHNTPLAPNAKVARTTQRHKG